MTEADIFNTNLGYQDHPYRVRIIRPSSFSRLESGYIGFNIELIGSAADPGNFNSSNMVWMTDHVPVTAVRYPGGTVANFFDWDAYQIDEKAVRLIKKKSMLGSIEWQKQINGDRLVTADFSSFMKLSIDRNLQRFVVLNVYNRDAKYNIRVIKDIKKSFDVPFFWELGNELSNYEYLYDLKIEGGWNEHIYAERASEIARFVKSNYPEDRVGVVVGELLDERMLKDMSASFIKKKLNSWDSALQSNDLFDAVIIHPYVFYYADDEWQRHYLTKLKKTPAASEIGASLPYMKLRWIFANAQELPNAYVKHIQKIFPNKKIWITETGLIGKTENEKINYQFTIIKALFNTAYFIHWLKEYPATQTYLFHLLDHGSSDAVAFFKDFSFNYNTISYAFIKEAFENAVGYSFIDVQNGPTYPGIWKYRDISVKGLIALYIKSNVDERILIVNASRGTVSLVLPFESPELIYFEGSSLSEVKPGEVKSFAEFPRSRLAGSEWLMPPLSIALVKGREIE